jgi:hypothetical protein
MNGNDGSFRIRDGTELHFYKLDATGDQSDYHIILTTFKPTNAGLSVPAGTLQLGVQLSALLGIWNGIETSALPIDRIWRCSSLPGLGRRKAHSLYTS